MIRIIGLISLMLLAMQPSALAASNSRDGYHNDTTSDGTYIAMEYGNEAEENPDNEGLPGGTVGGGSR